MAAFSADGQLHGSVKFPTNPDYEAFKGELLQHIQESFNDTTFEKCCCATPGRLTDDHEAVIAFGNLPWKNVPIDNDLEDLLKIPVIIENDAKLAGLSEAQLVLEQYKRVLYITISTGIGGGVIVNGKLDPDFTNFEPGQMTYEHEGKLVRWEQFGSGKAIVEKYGKRASEIDDPETWQTISKDIALGLYNLSATVQPDVIIIGGGVGSHFHKFGAFIEQDLKAIQNDIVPAPPVIGAQRPEEAVIYGCYELIRQTIGQ